MSEEKSESWAYLIPEFYFDLISRVPPGVLFVLAISYAVMPSAFAFHSPQTTEKFEGPTVTLFLLLIGAGYSCGILLTFLGAFLYDLYFPQIYADVANLYPEDLRLWIWNKIWTTSRCFQDWHVIPIAQLRLIYRRQHDYIKHNLPEAARLLPKLSAEGKLCDNTAAALLLAFVTFPAIRYLHSGSVHEWWPLPILLTFAIYCLGAARHRFRRLAMGQFSYAAFLWDEERKTA